MGGGTDEGTDTGFSTEDELASGADTDKDSVRSGSVVRSSTEMATGGTVMLLTLHVPWADGRGPPPTDPVAQQAWQTLQSQATCFAEANAPDTSACSSTVLPRRDTTARAK